MRKLISTACLLLAATTLFGQKNYTISGRLIDSFTHAAIPAATVFFTTNDRNDSARSTITDADGLFGFKNLRQVSGKINISSVGYANKIILITENQFSKNDSIHLAEIYLVPANKQLQGVIVTTTKPLIKQEIDRLSYDMQTDPKIQFTENFNYIFWAIKLLTVKSDWQTIQPLIKVEP